MCRPWLWRRGRANKKQARQHTESGDAYALHRHIRSTSTASAKRKIPLEHSSAPKSMRPTRPEPGATRILQLPTMRQELSGAQGRTTREAHCRGEAEYLPNDIRRDLDPRASVRFVRPCRPTENIATAR